MISVDLLSVLMRGIQARHLDWGTGTDAVEAPEEGFDQFFRDTANSTGTAAEDVTTPGSVQAMGSDAVETPASAESLGATASQLSSEALTAQVEETVSHEGKVEEAAETEAEPKTSSEAAEAMMLDMAAIPALARLQETAPRSGAEALVSETSARRFGTALMQNIAAQDAGSQAAVDAIGMGEALSEDALHADLATEEGAAPEQPARSAPAPAPANGATTQTLNGSAAAPSASAGLALSGSEADLGWRLSVDQAAGSIGVAREASATTGGVYANAPNAITSQVAVAIQASEGDRVEIRLDPPELGRVQIEMRVVEGTLHAIVVTERPETSDILRRHAEMLQRELESSGYGTVNLEFAAGHEDGAERQHERRAGTLQTLDGLAVMPALAQTSQGTGETRLDIRL